MTSTRQTSTRQTTAGHTTAGHTTRSASPSPAATSCTPAGPASASPTSASQPPATPTVATPAARANSVVERVRAVATSQRTTQFVIAAFRVVVAFLFGCHALVGFGFLGGIDGQGTAVEFGSWPGWWGSVIQLIGAALLLLGIRTRTTAIALSGVMAYAYFTVHQSMALLPLHNMGEPAALYCWIFLLIAATGPGRFRR
jgi:putative oxidoreductase